MYVLIHGLRSGAVCNALLLALATTTAFAGGIQTAAPTVLEQVTITATIDDVLETIDTASEGTVTAEQLENRPRLRVGEVLEVVPGLVVTQHSGFGKANQYFLRGFNLDHGTDFSTSVAGMPVNMPTHGHGQGYTDLNFLIPELISTVQYEKGTYNAAAGDFSAAGAARIQYADALDRKLASVELGEDHYQRYLLAGSTAVRDGALLGAFELGRQDGPWVVPEDGRRLNAVLRYSGRAPGQRYSLTAMAYDANWTATDQIPRRAVESGLISRFGSLDDSDGGESSRYSVSADWQRAFGDAAALRANAYFIDYDFELYSNFTYFLDDAVNGDQFQQVDRRRIYGGALDYERHGEVAGVHVHHQLGLQARYDDIGQVGLFRSARRQRLSTTRDDAVEQASTGVHYAATISWLEKFRSVTGVRADFYHFDVESDTPQNSGAANDAIVSPKLSLIFGPWAKTEFFANAGYGFHSNDARGATITVEPGDPATPVAKVDPLVRAKGAELGVKTLAIDHLQTSLTFWALDVDSELLFIGDAGNTEPSRPSRRSGIEFASYWTPLQGVILDADLTWSRARFRDADAAGDRIPGAIERSASIGLIVNDYRKFFGGLRLRYLGPRPLIEDDSVKSSSSTLVNARLGYAVTESLSVMLEVLNLFDRKLSDIDYLYESRLQTEIGDPSPPLDVHFHPAEPQTLRLALTARF